MEGFGVECATDGYAMNPVAIAYGSDIDRRATVSRTVWGPSFEESAASMDFAFHASSYQGLVNRHTGAFELSYPGTSAMNLYTSGPDELASTRVHKLGILLRVERLNRSRHAGSSLLADEKRRPARCLHEALVNVGREDEAQGKDPMIATIKTHLLCTR